MKFLCVPCDKPMMLEQTKKEQTGSVSLVYGCPDCGYEFAMLTNTAETQVVSSLGVKLGAGDPGASESKCPFTGMVQEMEAAGSTAQGFPWTAEAEARMAGVPDFVKQMVKAGIESYARDRGYEQVDERVLDEAKGRLGM